MKLVIAGGGFGGLKLARLLNNKKGFEIILIDRFNYHQFQPLFYQVATAGLDASNISFPLRKIFQKSKNVRIRMAEIKRIDTSAKRVVTDSGDIEYDILVLATGAGTNFFGNAELEQNAFPMKSTVEALQIRHCLMENLERAVTSADELELSRLMNIIVVGGGPTGVEISGAIAEMKLFVLPKDYPELDFSKMSIFLLEGSGKVLGSMSAKSSSQAKKYLEKLGVIVKLNTQVNSYNGLNLKLLDGNIIPSATVIWAAGIKGNIPGGFESLSFKKGNRLEVDLFNQVKYMDHIYAIGDIAAMPSANYPNGHPQVASVALQQAKNLAKNLKKQLRKESGLQAFNFNDRGSMATVGRNLAVVDIPKPKFHFGGFPAWLIWMTLHLMLILGVKNRLFVFLNWLYNYLTYDQSLRLIFSEFTRGKTSAGRL
ncbi:NAD(P)/FAD-dependent oxidoreductase [Flavihumibacter profundi]|jgi:NADH:ubiquinone reductase (H+-translocating)|uniref:NAD(P)/FAD-dependent oxidoreductase n=1 Tax=Flavihumibacter profundi TaxID=2716883 RepID=UPI001CC783DB|nr:NAD(P)/FAD-dependent oxidoreductase [Flavihumibacter profundi]MBZ5856173.1 NAD(P)/FAD-dependent oxidoreductase [Flavihumibacter profundi]